MFTGLCAGMGVISSKRPKGGEVELTVTADFDWGEALEIGESIAVCGVCLTVTGLAGERGFTAFASAETMSRTTLGEARRVNLERALTLSTRLGGHLVSGHVDATGRVKSIAESGSSLAYHFEAEPALMPFIVPKGSITIEGISLTVNDVFSDGFTVNVIPHTAEITTLGLLKPGARVNLETDILGKYVHRLMNFDKTEKPAEGLTFEFLAQNGFLR